MACVVDAIVVSMEMCMSPQVRSTKHFCVDVILICVLLSIGVFIFQMYKK